MKKELKEIIILSVIILSILGGAFALMANHKGDVYEEAKVSEDVEVTTEVVTSVDETSSGGGEAVEEVKEQLESVTGLVIGLDANRGNTDVLMAVNLNTETNEVKLISIPRDLEIDFMSEPFKSMRLEFNEKVANGEIDANKHQRSNSLINSIYADTGLKTAGFYYTKEVIEEMTGLQIDYLAIIDVYGFTEIIDAAGGVDFDVPRNMYWNDPAQDLLIDLKKGNQHLDGDKAMQLVRFRRYKTGDIERIKVQQDFMVALYNQLSQIRDVSVMMDIVEAAYNIAETDFGLTTALEYGEYIFNLDVADLMNTDNMLTVPSWGYKEEYEDDEGVLHVKYHQYWDHDKVLDAVDELLNN